MKTLFAELESQLEALESVDNAILAAREEELPEIENRTYTFNNQHEYDQFVQQAETIRHHNDKIRKKVEDLQITYKSLERVLYQTIPDNNFYVIGLKIISRSISDEGHYRVRIRKAN